MWRLRVPMSGSGLVGAGVTTLYALDGSSGFPAATRTLLAAFAGSMPTAVTWDVPNTGDVINPATGEITGTWTDGTDPAPVSGASGAAFALGVGAQVRWHTSGIVAGRRVVGSTFVVPLSSGAFESNGTLLSTVIAAWQSAAAAYITSVPGAVVWSRPYAGDPTATPPKPARVGSTHLIGSATVPDRPSWLVSRRR